MDKKYELAFPVAPELGLNKREYFAAMAMQGYLSNPEFVGDMADAVRAADALLEELAK